LLQQSAVHEPMLPFGWTGAQPRRHRVTHDVGSAAPASWRVAVIDKLLDCGIRVTAQRCGLTSYDFAGWPPGLYLRRGPRTARQASTEDGPALDQSLLMINAHQILLHSAAMVKDNESPHVSEVDEHDLLGWEFDEETGEGYWCSSRHGAVGHVVTAADRDRAGFVHTETFEMSLAWLDDVVNDTCGRRAPAPLRRIRPGHCLTTNRRATAERAGWPLNERSTKSRRRLSAGYRAGSERPTRR
jgi:hypothetical protein